MKQQIALISVALCLSMSAAFAVASNIRVVDQPYQFQGSNKLSPRPYIIRLNCDGETILGYRIIYSSGDVPGFGKDPHTPLLFKFEEDASDSQIYVHMAGLFDPKRGTFPVTFRYYCVPK